MLDKLAVLCFWLFARCSSWSCLSPHSLGFWAQEHSSSYIFTFFVIVGESVLARNTELVNVPFSWFILTHFVDTLLTSNTAKNVYLLCKLGLSFGALFPQSSSYFHDNQWQHVEAQQCCLWAEQNRRYTSHGKNRFFVKIGYCSTWLSHS